VQSYIRIKSINCLPATFSRYASRVGISKKNLMTICVAGNEFWVFFYFIFLSLVISIHAAAAGRSPFGIRNAVKPKSPPLSCRLREFGENEISRHCATEKVWSARLHRVGNSGRIQCGVRCDLTVT